MFDPTMLRMDGDIASITGIGAETGKTMAQTFTAVGASVAVSDLKAKTAESAATETRAVGGKAIGVDCNVTEESTLEALVAATDNAFDKVAIRVDNAGGSGPKSFDMPMEDFRWAYELDVSCSLALLARGAFAASGARRIAAALRRCVPSTGSATR